MEGSLSANTGNEKRFVLNVEEDPFARMENAEVDVPFVEGDPCVSTENKSPYAPSVV